MEEEVIIDMEGSLKMYAPFLFEFLQGTKLPPKKWKRINDAFKRDYKIRQAQLADIRKASDKDPLRVEANLYDTIVATIKGNKAAGRLLDYFRVLFQSLTNSLSDSERLLLRKTIYNVLINLDHKYRNFIGELAVLNAFVEDKDYTLVKVDKGVIEGDRTADFTLRSNKTHKSELVEVVNIHFDDKDTDLKRLLRTKLDLKINEKTNGKEKYNPFTLVPVVWAPIVDLVRLRDMYNSPERLNIPNVTEPMAYACLFNDNGTYYYDFAPITSLLTAENIEVVTQ